VLWRHVDQLRPVGQLNHLVPPLAPDQRRRGGRTAVREAAPPPAVRGLHKALAPPAPVLHAPRATAEALTVRALANRLLDGQGRTRPVMVLGHALPPAHLVSGQT
jgi:hypothetical protein